MGNKVEMIKCLYPPCQKKIPKTNSPQLCTLHTDWYERWQFQQWLLIAAQEAIQMQKVKSQILTPGGSPLKL